MVRTIEKLVISRDPVMGELKKKRSTTSAVVTAIIMVRKNIPIPLKNLVTEKLMLSRKFENSTVIIYPVIVSGKVSLI